MHDIQKRLISLGSVSDLSQYTYRQLAERTGAPHAAQVRHHLLQLERTGTIVRDEHGALRAVKSVAPSTGPMLMIPVLGEVDCGVAATFANDSVIGYLSVSPSSTRIQNIDGIFALRARGDSMDEADVYGKSVENSDYVLVKKYDGEHVRDGEYVVSLINGMANLKKFRCDRTHNRIALISESSKHYPPIFIAESDREYYEVIGKAIDIIKGIAHILK
jgi:SOS-response transcriptional repressor LexA